MIDYIGVSDILRLVTRIGTARSSSDWPTKSSMITALERIREIRRLPPFRRRRHRNSCPPATDACIPSNTSMSSQEHRRRISPYRFGVLADVQTGYPLLLSELTVTTALRTARCRRLRRGISRDRTAASWRSSAMALRAISGHRIHRILGYASCGCSTPTEGDGKLEQNLRAMPELDALKIVAPHRARRPARARTSSRPSTADKRTPSS